MLKSVLFLFSMILLISGVAISGCGVSKSVTGGGGTRNPSVGLSYDFKINRVCPEGAGCKAGDIENCRATGKFNDARSFCAALLDSSLNHGCARLERKSRFSQDCAGVFEDTNINGWNVNEQVCRAVSAQQNFRTRTEFCADLTNETRYQGCAFDFRRAKAEAYECGR